jgi:hypothetical protein
MKSFDDSSKKRHRNWLLLFGAVFIAAFALDVRDDDRVAPRGLPSCPLPETCTTRSLFGIDCPGCGLTRSFIHLAHGEWAASLRSHRVGWVLAMAVLMQFPYRFAALIYLKDQPLGARMPRIFGGFLIALLLGNWLFNQINM